MQVHDDYQSDKRGNTVSEGDQVVAEAWSVHQFHQLSMKSDQWWYWQTVPQPWSSKRKCAVGQRWSLSWWYDKCWKSGGKVVFFIVELYWCLSELWHCLILLGVLEVSWFYATLIIFVDDDNNNNNNNNNNNKRWPWIMAVRQMLQIQWRRAVERVVH